MRVNSHSFDLSTVQRYKQRVYILSETKAVLRDEIKERGWEDYRSSQNSLGKQRCSCRSCESGYPCTRADGTETERRADYRSTLSPTK